MRWKNRKRSSNVEDRRRTTTKKKAGIGGGLIIAAVMAYFLKDPSVFFNALSQQSGQILTQTTQSKPTVAENQAAELASVVLADLEVSWETIFKKANINYIKPKLVLFTGSVDSGCGYATAQSGPFYCSLDQKIYLDLVFLNELKRLGAPGDFAFAYVIAHEVGHHISNFLGILPKANNKRKNLSKIDSNKISILLELQADCFAGIWARQANKRGLLEVGDVEEGLQAAASVGDDALIGNRPDMFTHGTSKQRVYWLKQGINGDIGNCDTFKKANVSL